MHAGTGKTEQYLPRRYRIAGQLFAPFHCTDAEAGKIVIARAIHTRHFRRFPADQRTAGNSASFRYSGDYTLCHAMFQFAGGEVIEEKQRFRTLNDQIVHAHGDQIDPHAVMPIMVDRQFQFGAHPIIGGNQQRIAETGRPRIEKPAETAQFRIRTWAGSGFHQGADGAHQSVTRLDIDTRAGIGVGGAFAIHFAALIIRAWISTFDWAEGAKFSTMSKPTLPLLPLRSLLLQRPVRFILVLAAASLALMAARILLAQVEGDRGIAAVVSSTDIEVGDIAVDVRGKDAADAREAGWRDAQRKAWASLDGPELSDSQLDGLVSSIVIEQERVGPRRYIATLGVIFDRARASQFLGRNAERSRSAPMMLLPVTISGGAVTMYEHRNPWQQAWAEYQAGASRIDYVRPSGAGNDSLLLNYGQTNRRSRLWWRNILDDFDAADVLIPIARLDYRYPGGPVDGRFTARYGPDNTYLDSFTMTAKGGADLPRMLRDAVKRFDAIFSRALADGTLTPNPSLRFTQDGVDPVIQQLIDIGRAADSQAQAERAARANADRNQATDPAEVPEAAPQTAVTANFTVQFASPDAGAIDGTLAAVRATAGVRGAATTSLAIGGTSVMNVTYAGSLAELAAALRSSGFTVTQGSNALAIRR